MECDDVGKCASERMRKHDATYLIFLQKSSRPQFSHKKRQ